MTRCLRCNRFMFFSSRSGYCNSCAALAIAEEKEARIKAEQEIRELTDALHHNRIDRQQTEEGSNCRVEEKVSDQEADTFTQYGNANDNYQEGAALIIEEDSLRNEETSLHATETSDNNDSDLNGKEYLIQEQEGGTEVREASREQEDGEIQKQTGNFSQNEMAQKRKILSIGMPDGIQWKDEEWSEFFSHRANSLLEDARQRFDRGEFDEELLKLLRHAMIYADESSIEWEQAKVLHEKTRIKIAEADARERNAENENKRQEKEKRESNMMKYHIGLIGAEGFFDRRGNIRDYTFITMIDGYNSKMAFWYDYCVFIEANDEDVIDNENFVDDEEMEYKQKKEIYFHKNKLGKGSIKDVIDLLRSDSRYEFDSGVGVVFSVQSDGNKKKAINVITLRDALESDKILQEIREKIKKDINVYFFLMNHVADLYEKYFSGIAFEEVWKYRELNDGIEITGTNLTAHVGKYSDSRDNYFLSSRVVVPDFIAGKPVISISSSAFANIKGVNEFILPDNVKAIGDGAFENCECIFKIKLPSKIKKIEERTFAGCTRLMDIKLPDGLTEINAKAFANTGLREITIPFSVKSIDDSAFLNCNIIIRKRLK